MGGLWYKNGMKTKQIIKTGLKSFLKNTLKMASWQIFLIILAYDVLWRLFVPSFIRSHQAAEKMRKKTKARQDFQKRIKDQATKENFTESMKKLWEERK